MATAHLSADELLRAIQRLGMREIEQLLARILRLRAERSAPSLSSIETELLLRINQGLPEHEGRRYQELMDRRRAGILKPEEHRELLRLTDAAEALQAERVRYLAELAKLRGTSLNVLVEELGLQPS
jgi:DNA repair photolyase